jgi:hypothetical protein
VGKGGPKSSIDHDAESAVPTRSGAIAERLRVGTAPKSNPTRDSGLIEIPSSHAEYDKIDAETV